MKDDYDIITDAMMAGDIEKLEEIYQMIDDFPNGKDKFIQRYWITNAIDLGTYEVIQWVLKKGVDLNFEDDEGYTPLHSAIERKDRKNPYMSDVIKLLIDYGAPLNERGFNDWTPLHQAAVREDIETLQVLVNAGADLNIRTRIDEYSTPYEEAKSLGSTKSVKFLEQYL